MTSEPNAGQVIMAKQMSEAQLESAIKRKCVSLGLLYYHTYRSTRSEKGYPDDTIVGPAGVLFRECKRQSGKASVDQVKWLTALAVAGADVAIWKPIDLFNGVIDADLLRVSGRRKATR